MQNITLFSFLTHIVINSFFAAKKWLGFDKDFTRISSGVGYKAANATISILLVGFVIIINVYHFGSIVKTDYEQGTGHTQLINMLQNEKVSAQVSIPAYIPVQIKRSLPETSCSTPSTSNTAPKAEAIPNPPSFYTTVIKKNGTLWEASRKLLFDFMGEDPCAGITGVQGANCQKVLNKEINTQVSYYLRYNGLVSADGRSLLKIKPGAIVTLDRYGNMTVGY